MRDTPAAMTSISSGNVRVRSAPLTADRVVLNMAAHAAPGSKPELTI